MWCTASSGAGAGSRKLPIYRFSCKRSSQGEDVVASAEVVFHSCKKIDCYAAPPEPSPSGPKSARLCAHFFCCLCPASVISNFCIHSVSIESSSPSPTRTSCGYDHDTKSSSPVGVSPARARGVRSSAECVVGSSRSTRPTSAPARRRKRISPLRRRR